MITYDLQHPDTLGWEVDEDLRRASLILAARSASQKTDSASHDSGYAALSSTEIQPQHRRVEARTTYRLDASHQAPVAATKVNPRPAITSPSTSEYPASPQGGWRPWVFAATGFVGGNIAMTMGGMSPNYLPTIVIAEVILGVLLCVAFYPRMNRTSAAH